MKNKKNRKNQIEIKKQNKRTLNKKIKKKILIIKMICKQNNIMIIHLYNIMRTRIMNMMINNNINSFYKRMSLIILIFKNKTMMMKIKFIKLKMKNQ